MTGARAFVKRKSLRPARQQTGCECSCGGDEGFGDSNSIQRMLGPRGVQGSSSMNLGTEGYFEVTSGPGRAGFEQLGISTSLAS